MSNGDIAQYDHIRGLNEVEFFSLMEVYKSKQKNNTNGRK